jgi:transposase-like protein
VDNRELGCKIRTPFKKTETRFGIPKIKGRVHYDEKYVWVRDRWEFALTAIDNMTFFILSGDVVIERTLAACVSFLRTIKAWRYAQIL